MALLPLGNLSLFVSDKLGNWQPAHQQRCQFCQVPSGLQGCSGAAWEPHVPALQVKAKLELGMEKEQQHMKRHVKLLLPFVDQKGEIRSKCSG